MSDESLPAQAPLTILIAEDSDSDRLILQAILRKLGHRVITAADGVDAVERFREECPQLVLLDALMPRMDGMEAAREIKALAGEALIPIIFLTSLSDADALARCLDAGGDDFLSKPYNRTIIEAKINAFNRMRLMHQTLQHQRDLIRENNQQLVHEQQTARRVFDNIAHTGCLDAANIRYVISPLSVFNGDVLFACPKPSGGMHVFLGDFTGHGLPAAVGAMPLAEIFYGMTSKGFTVGDILRELNQKLKRILPAGFFCCAAMIDVDLHLGEVEVWNGGLPEGYLLHLDGTRTALPSRHLALGVLPPDRFSAKCERLTMRDGERLLFYSDGLEEAADASGAMFGQQRVHTVLNQNPDPTQVFDCLKTALDAFTGASASQDDVTMVEIAMVPEDLLESLQKRVSQSALAGPSQWCCSYELRGDTLRHFNPLPLMLHICLEVPGLRLFSGPVYTILAELYSNALEHGILGLSSELKSTPEGFTAYYLQREARLQGNIDAHFIRLTLDHRSDGLVGGVLSITCEDSGPGFDYTQRQRASSGLDRFSGRGIGLVDSFCEAMTYHDAGNKVTADFRWSLDTRPQLRQGSRHE